MPLKWRRSCIKSRPRGDRTSPVAPPLLLFFALAAREMRPRPVRAEYLEERLIYVWTRCLVYSALKMMNSGIVCVRACVCVCKCELVRQRGAHASTRNTDTLVREAPTLPHHHTHTNHEQQ